MDLEEEEIGVGRLPEKDLGQDHIREVGKGKYILIFELILISDLFIESHFQDRDLFLTGVKTSKLVPENRSQEVGHPTRIESTRVEEDHGTATKATISSEEAGRYRDHNPGESAVVHDVIGQSHEEATLLTRKGANPARTRIHNNRSRGTPRPLHLEQAVVETTAKNEKKTTSRTLPTGTLTRMQTPP